MRIVFFGTPELAVAPLAALSREHDVVALVCQPDRPKGRGKKLVAPPTKLWAEEHGVPVHQPAKLNDGTFEAWLREQQPALCAVAAYGRLLKQPILDVPAMGFLNLHPSLLPKYRGASPIQSAILNGDSETGVTIMKVILEMDAGDILLQETTPIAPDDTTESLSVRLSEQGAELLLKGVNLVESGQAAFIPQDESRVVHCSPLEKQDGLIDWTRPATEIHNLVRAAIPWPVAHTPFKGVILRVYETKPVNDSPDAPPGTVLRVEKDAMAVSTGEGALLVLQVQAPGKRVMSVDDYLRGNPVQVGDRLGEE